MCQFETIMKECLQDFSVGDKGQYYGICASEEEIEELFTRLKCVGYSYSVRSSTHHQRSVDATNSKPRFFFMQSQGNIEISFFGSPFSVEYVSYMQCTLGPMYYDKIEVAVDDHLADHVIPTKKRKLLMDTKKSDCPAIFLLKCVRVYPGYLVQSVNDREMKKKVIDSLKQHWEFPNKPESYLRFYVFASPPEHHTHSVECMKANGELHPRLAMEIMNHVKNGTTSIREIKLLLERFVEETLSGPDKPDRVNTTFYPTNRTIYNHVYRSLLKIRKTGFEEAALEIQVGETHDCATSSSCTSQPNSVGNDVLNTSSNAERNKEHNIPEKSSSHSSLHQEVRDMCKNIINLTYSCNNETIKKLLDGLKKVQCSIEFSDPAGNGLPLVKSSNSKK